VQSWRALAHLRFAKQLQLRYDAQMTIDALNCTLGTEDVFKDVFLKDHRSLATRFDVVIRHVPGSFKEGRPKTNSGGRVDLNTLKVALTPHAVLDAGSPSAAMVASLCKCIHRGLGDRVKAIAVFRPPVLPASVSNEDVKVASESYPPWLSVGLILDVDNAYRLVDHGPAASEEESAETQEFRAFWGEKAELRRFKDGRITESVVWPAPSTDDRLHIPVVIIKHILARHFGIPASGVTSWQADFDASIRLPPSVASAFSRNGIAGGFKPALSAFQDLLKLLKSMDDELPLGVLNISPLSSALRQTSAFAPIPIPATQVFRALPVGSRYIQPMEIVVDYEKSARWPDDLQAIQKVKLAFFEQMASALKAKLPGAQVDIVLATEASPIEDAAALQVLTADGWAFTARIHHDREATLLDRIIDDRSHIKVKKAVTIDPETARMRRMALSARNVYLRRFIHGPAHHRAVASVCSQFPAFAGTVRLVKRWFASHWLLGTHVSPEALELIVSAVFADIKGARFVPGTREKGFVRVIEFLRDWRWEDGLFTRLYELDADGPPVPSSDQGAASSPAAWHIRTGADTAGTVWTSCGPDAVVARRVQALAAATYDVLAAVSTGTLDVKASFLHTVARPMLICYTQSLFTHPTGDYDVILELDRSVLPRYAQNVHANEGSLHQLGDRQSPLQVARVDFDPARMLCDDLQVSISRPSGLPTS
jgi:U3 small nucleolar RNA-associated protein 22